MKYNPSYERLTDELENPNCWSRTEVTSHWEAEEILASKKQ
jgi:hypothetical protein